VFPCLRGRSCFLVAAGSRAEEYLGMTVRRNKRS
jgi:hypothetical protein